MRTKSALEKDKKKAVRPVSHWLARVGNLVGDFEGCVDIISEDQ